jgi:hypothetical protein
LGAHVIGGSGLPLYGSPKFRLVVQNSFDSASAGAAQLSQFRVLGSDRLSEEAKLVDYPARLRDLSGLVCGRTSE